jgi:hypothetical protein
MKKFIYPVLALVPTLAFAQSLGNLDSLVINIRNLINNILPVLLALAVLYFFWGLITYIRAAGDPKKADEGKSIMIWGIVALFVMVSVWGLVNILVRSFNLDNTAPASPGLPPG